jgi:signal transduction histidine kinase
VNSEWPIEAAGMNERIHALDWSLTPLGPMESWPATMRSTVDMLVACSFPMVALWGPELSQIYNDGYATIMAAKHPAGLGQATRDCWPEVWHFNRPIYERVLGGDTVTLENQLFPITRHGYVEDAYFTLCYSPLRDEAGCNSGVLVTVFETTQRLSAERALRENEEKLRAYTRASTNALYEMSADWSSMSQLDGDVFLADTKSADCDWIDKYIHASDQPQVLKAIQTAIETKSPFELEHRVLRVDGTLGWTHSRAIPLLDNTGKIRNWFGAASDITERKQMESALKQKEKLAAVGQIASTIAHEINNPLESVTNLLYLAQATTENPEAVDYLDKANMELRRVAAITSQTLRFHRQLTKATNTTPEALFFASTNTYQGRLQNSHIQVEHRYRASGTFHCLEGEIQQVLNNLIGNAVDAMKQHGGKLVLRSADVFDWKTGQSFVRMTVADSGTGIPNEILRDIFHPFFTTKGFSGSGLGLWISKEIMDRHQGRLCVRSSTRLGRTGTVFTMLLPKQPVSQNQ